MVTGAGTSASEVVTLQKCDKLDLSAIKSVKDCIPAAANPDNVAVIEETVQVWCRQIAQVCRAPGFSFLFKILSCWSISYLFFFCIDGGFNKICKVR